MTAQIQHADVLVVGSGPGGATVARQLARAGRSVTLLERGGDHRGKWYYGGYVGAVVYTDAHATLLTKQNIHIIRPLMLGGATGMYAGCATPPPAWLGADYGIDLHEQTRETWQELGVAPLPPELRGEASSRLAAAAQALGFDWQPQDKLFRPERAEPFSCGANCLLGCRCGAKWNAAEWVDDAVTAGATVLTKTRVTDLLTDGRQVVGVLAERRGETLELRADRVVLSAGGVGTAKILRRAGFGAAGQGMALDTTVMVYGRSPTPGVERDPPMSWSFKDDALGVMYSSLIDPRLLFPVMAMASGMPNALAWLNYGRMLGVMIKLTDELSGDVPLYGPIDKPMSADETTRMEQAIEVARRVLVEAGARPSSIFVSPMRGTHPSATVRIDEMLDRNLQTEIQGLYVCDASVFPRALGQPTVVTIIALARRLAAQLASTVPATTEADRS